MTLSSELFATALKLLAGEPTDADVRRAVSTTYYALFHHLSAEFSSILVRPSLASFTRAWVQVYRYPDHGPVKDRCLEAQKVVHGFPVALVSYAETFVQMQQLRTDADYNPAARITPIAAVAWIIISEQAIADFSSEPTDHQRAFVLFLCLRPKAGRR